MSNSKRPNPAAVVPPLAQRAIALARAGDTAGALVAVEAALAGSPRDVGLLMFAGSLACRAGDPGRGIEWFAAALALAPGEDAIRVELAHALLASGDSTAVIDLVGARADARGDALARGFARLRAHADAAAGRWADAAAAYRALVAADGQDFESWQGLGHALLADGDPAAAEPALEQALVLRPGLVTGRGDLGRARLALGDAAGAVAAFAAALQLRPGDPDLLAALGEASAAAGDHAAAAAAFRSALMTRPGDVSLTAGLAAALERINRLDELEAVLDAAAKHGIGDADLGLIRARLLRRRGRLAEAAVAVAADRHEDDPRRAREIGEIADRLGDSARAFAAFSTMNALDRAARPDWSDAAAGFRATLDHYVTLTNPEWLAGWPTVSAGERPAPVFLFGFPRSGTTLLDTMLLGHPRVVVMEEAPVLQQVADRIGDPARIAVLTPAEVIDLRRVYWAAADAVAGDTRGCLLVDKFPLGLVGTAIVHRLFPDARYVFAERHPCDAVLSSFFTRFNFNAAMANFLRLDDAARLYDSVLGYWQQCRAVFPLAVHSVRYERMIDDPEAELRPLTDFLGLEWDPRLIAHQHSAAARDFISSASYAQVTEPLYRRAAGRWRRYEQEMGEVLPLLLPWADRLGYPR